MWNRIIDGVFELGGKLVESGPIGIIALVACIVIVALVIIIYRLIKDRGEDRDLIRDVISSRDKLQKSQAEVNAAHDNAVTRLVEHNMKLVEFNAEMMTNVRVSLSQNTDSLNGLKDWVKDRVRPTGG